MYCCTVPIAALYTVVAGLLASSQCPDCTAAGQAGTGFLGIPVSVCKRMLRCFQRIQFPTDASHVALSNYTFFSYFTFMFMLINHCHRVTAQLQLI